MSLLEVVISISILSIAALAIILTVTRIMVAQGSSSHQTVARLIAESALEKVALAGPHPKDDPINPGQTPQDWDTTDEPFVRVLLARVGQTPRDTEFRLQVYATRIEKEDEAGAPMFPAGPDMGELWELEIRIWWNADDEGPEAAVERGLQSLSVSKLVYAES